MYWKTWQTCWLEICSSSPPWVFVKTNAAQISRKFTWEQPCKTVISIKLLAILLTSHFRMGALLQIYSIFAEYNFWRTPMGDCFWICNITKLVKMLLKSSYAYLSYPLLLKLFFYKWCTYIIFMYDRSICW